MHNEEDFTPEGKYRSASGNFEEHGRNDRSEQIADQTKHLRHGERIDWSMFPNLDAEELQRAAELLIEQGNAEILFRNFDQFDNLNHKRITDKLIECRQGHDLACFLEKLDVDHKDVANRLIESEQPQALTKYYKNFRGLNDQAIADKLLTTNKGVFALSVFLQNFRGLNQKTAMQLIEDKSMPGTCRSVAFFLPESFSNVDNSAVALKMITTGHVEDLADLLDRFQNLNTNVAKKLVEAGYAKHTIKNRTSFDVEARDYVSKIDEAKK